MNQELPDEHAGLEKAEEPEVKLPHPLGHRKSKKNARKIYTSASLTMLKPLLCESQQTVENS